MSEPIIKASGGAGCALTILLFTGAFGGLMYLCSLALDWAAR